MSDRTATKSKNYLIAAAIFVIIAPIFTVAFSKFGLDYFRSHRNEMVLLKDSIRLAPFLSVSGNGKDTFSHESIKGHLSLLHFYDDEQSPAWGELKRVQQEYRKDETDRLKILYLSIPINPLDSNWQPSNKVGLDSLNWFAIQHPNVADILQKAQIQPQDAKYKILLVEAKGFLCKAYDTRNKDEINRLLRHISIIIPKTKRKKYVYKPETVYFEN